MLADKIREFRVNMGLTQQQLGEMVTERVNKSVSKQSIAGYEQGRRDVSTDVLMALADVFNTSTEVLLGREDGAAYRKPGLCEKQMVIDEKEEVQMLATWVRAQRMLSPEDRKKLFNIIRVSFPELFLDTEDDSDKD